MKSYQREFLELAIHADVLGFGEFTLKSGRVSPYFFNAGRFRTGLALARLGQHYAAAINASGLHFDMLFGPAYKGIALAATTAIALAERYGRDVPLCFNRKEAKDHGEGGHLIGAPLKGRVLIVDDVITAGTAVGESVEMIRAAGAEPAGVLIALDRQERGPEEISAVQAVKQRYGLDVVSIVRLDDLLSFLRARPTYAEAHQRIRAYRAEYGA